MTTLTVRGVGVARCQPDEVELQLSVQTLDPAPDAALDAVASRQALVDAILDHLGVATAARRTVGATVSEEWEWNREERVFRGFRATASTRLRLTDPAIVGPLLRRATAEAGAQVQGPWWQVLPTNPGRAEACALAAADARAKADAYAAALGLRVGRAVEAFEPGTRPAPRTADPTIARAMAVSSAPEELGVGGGELDVTAAIDVTYDLLDA
jgi:hypothetical protein